MNENLFELLIVGLFLLLLICWVMKTKKEGYTTAPSYPMTITNPENQKMYRNYYNTKRYNPARLVRNR